MSVAYIHVIISAEIDSDYPRDVDYDDVWIITAEVDAEKCAGRDLQNLQAAVDDTMDAFGTLDWLDYLTDEEKAAGKATFKGVFAFYTTYGPDGRDDDIEFERDAEPAPAPKKLDLPYRCPACGTDCGADCGGSYQ